MDAGQALIFIEQVLQTPIDIVGTFVGVLVILLFLLAKVKEQLP